MRVQWRKKLHWEGLGVQREDREDWKSRRGGKFCGQVGANLLRVGSPPCADHYIPP